jgi:hypothetical protein
MTELRLMKLVAPFYLSMMGSVVSEAQVDLIPQVASLGRRALSDDVVSLLRGHWRESCMGAWYSLFHDPTEVGNEVLASLHKSLGILNACALMVTAVELVGVPAVPAIEEYAARDRANQWGGEGFALAALKHLGQVSTGNEPTADDCAKFAALLKFAQELRSAPEASMRQEIWFRVSHWFWRTKQHLSGRLRRRG